MRFGGLLLLAGDELTGQGCGGSNLALHLTLQLTLHLPQNAPGKQANRLHRLLQMKQYAPAASLMSMAVRIAEVKLRQEAPQ